MKILHLDSSINYEFSVTRQLSAETVKQLMATSQGNQLTYRDLVKDEISHLTGKSLQNSGLLPDDPQLQRVWTLSENYQMLWSLSFLKAT